jgi:3-oxoacyl-[acyl-carrier-protein] synthase-1
MKKAYINTYASQSCAGNTEELMDAVYKQKSAISIDTSYIENIPVGLGKMQYDNFFDTLKDVVSGVLDSSNLQNFSETLLIVGSSVGGMAESEHHYFKDKSYKNINPARHIISAIEDSLNSHFSFVSSRSISTACTSSANALLLAKRLINVGAYKNILVVGADMLCYTTVYGFHSLNVLASKPCRPFDEQREGMNVAEAVAVLLIQDEMQQQGVELAGVGASSDAYHMTNPDPEAKGAISAMQRALLDANVSYQLVDYINAHGTGTIANDNVEALAVEKLFNMTPVSSTKAITGHTLGAAGALEAIIACEVIKKGKIPPQTALQTAQNKNINIAKKTLSKNINYVLSNSFAFGGNNTSILFGAVQ